MNIKVTHFHDTKDLKWKKKSLNIQKVVKVNSSYILLVF